MVSKISCQAVSPNTEILHEKPRSGMLLEGFLGIESRPSTWSALLRLDKASVHEELLSISLANESAKS